ncbi:MAG: hypothetical protein JW751_07915 [Polyangiaceae bacterium]|nr:hypothetical protein [Polyangiaceae bacterium]
MVHRGLLSGAASLLALGCAEYPEFETMASVESVRLLAMQADPSLTQPGASVTLRALWADGRTADPAPVSRAWFFGCANPAGDALSECLKDLNAAPRGDGAAWPARFEPVPGDSASFELPADLLDGRSGYGIAFYFFAACRGGDLAYEVSEDDAFPVVCRDGGRSIGSEDFVVGYRTVVVTPWPELRNANPEIAGITIDGAPVEPDCLDADCLDAPPRDCTTETCASVVACTEENAAADDEANEEGANCEPAELRVELAPESAEIDWYAGGMDRERLWVRYFVDRGTTGADFAVLHYPDTGWDRDAYGELFLPRGAARLWVVVYDSMTGVSWARMTLNAD